MQNKKEGYILILTVIMMGALSAIAVFMFNRGMSVVPYLTVCVSREKAKMLARGGVEIARALLADFPEDSKTEKQDAQEVDETEKVEKAEEKQKTGKNRSAVSQEQKFLERILPFANRFHRFVLKDSIDGVEGTVDIFISCEEGKININKIFDFKNKKFIGQGLKQGDFKILLETILKSPALVSGGGDLLAALERFLQKQQIPLDDVSQLLEIPECAEFKDKLFVTDVKNGESQIALADLFTVYGSTISCEPWLLSRSLLRVLGVEDKQTSDQRKKGMAEWLKQFKKYRSWPSDWNIGLKNMYQKEFNTLPKGVDSFFAANFNPKFFSVLVIARVDNMIQKMYAIIERVNSSHNNQIVYDSVIRKWYVL